MTELSITGANAITYPHLDIWNWTIGMYLYLGGLTAGVMIIAAVVQLKEKSITSNGDRPVSCYLGPILSCLLLSAGMFFVFFDLTRKFNSFWLYLSFNPVSPMSWGAWGVGIIIPLTFIWGIASLPDKYRHLLKWKFLENLYYKLMPHIDIFARISLGLGIFLGIYTGILLSFFVARPLWNNALLPILFVNSGLSTGTALLIIIGKDPMEKMFLTKLDIGLIASEIGIIVLFFASHLTSTAPHIAAIAPFFTKGLYFPFWVTVFILGIFLPMALVLDILKVKGYTKFIFFRIHLSAWFVLIGGLVIRLAFVYVGQLSSIMYLSEKW